MFKEKKMFSICECLLHRNGKEKLFHSSPRRNFPGETFYKPPHWDKNVYIAILKGYLDIIYEVHSPHKKSINKLINIYQ